MRLHIVSLPHTQTTKAYNLCAYTEKVRKFCNMMTARGHEVFLYASEDNEAACKESVICITKKQQEEHGFSGPQDYLKIDFNDPKLWGFYNRRVIQEIQVRLEPQDLICLITASAEVKNSFPDNLTVEFGVGYKGIMNPGFRVFESYAWRNFCYGKYDLEGAFYDEVIPNYFEVDDFPFRENKSDSYLFVGRINANKGLSIAQDVCEKLGKELIVAGPGEFSGYGEYIGTIDTKQRGQLMSSAKALFVPTLYIPPFEGVHIEAQLCGTPVITTDFGVFAETVENGVNGYRCKNFKEFMEAAQMVDTLSPLDIAATARTTYSTETVAKQYEQYFERLMTLYSDGFYST